MTLLLMRYPSTKKQLDPNSQHQNIFKALKNQCMLSKLNFGHWGKRLKDSTLDWK